MLKYDGEVKNPSGVIVDWGSGSLPVAGDEGADEGHVGEVAAADDGDALGTSAPERGEDGELGAVDLAVVPEVGGEDALGVGGEGIAGQDVIA